MCIHVMKFPDYKKQQNNRHTTSTKDATKLSTIRQNQHVQTAFSQE